MGKVLAHFLFVMQLFQELCMSTTLACSAGHFKTAAPTAWHLYQKASLTLEQDSSTATTMDVSAVCSRLHLLGLILSPSISYGWIMLTDSVNVLAPRNM
jgi:hypothetical protein